MIVPVLYLVIIAVPAFALHIYCEHRCTLLDVETGRRDSMALVDDYGSNRGWYWQWKIPSILGALIAAPGVFIGGVALFLLAMGA